MNKSKTEGIGYLDHSSSFWISLAHQTSQKTHDVFHLDYPGENHPESCLSFLRSRIGFEHDQHLETFEYRCWRRGGWRGFQRAGDHWYRCAGDAQGIFAVEAEQAVFLPGPGHEKNMEKRRVGETTRMLL